MRLSLSLLCIVALAATGYAWAQQSTTPGYTKFDQQQFGKLRFSVGNWKCVDVPANKKPHTQTVRQAGNYFVMREAGDSPNTEYTRWSHSYKMYYTVEVDDDGGTSAYMSKDLDPFNGTWNTVFPARMPEGKPYFARPFFPSTVSSSGNTITYTGRYYDNNGVVKSYRSTCTKGT